MTARVHIGQRRARTRRRNSTALAWLLDHDEQLDHIALAVKILLGVVFVIGMALAGIR